MALDENGEFIQSANDDYDPYAGLSDAEKAGLVQGAETYYGSSADPNDVQTGPNGWVNGAIDVPGHEPVDWQNPDSYQWLINNPGAAPGAAPRPPGVPGRLGPTSGGGGGGSQYGQFGANEGPFQYPDWVPPTVAFEKWQAPTRDMQPFQYEDFKGPTAENFQADPGYQFRADQMDRTIKNAKSAQGLLATGNTLADLMSYRGGLASQEYGNVYNRQFGAWDANRNKALDTWKSGHDLSNENYQHSLTDYLTRNASNEGEWNRDLTKYQTNLGKTATGYGLGLDAQQLQLQGQNNQFGNLLSLYGLMTRNMPSYAPEV